MPNRFDNGDSTAFYVCTAAFYVYCLYYNLMYIYRPGTNHTILTYDGYGGKFKYLTFWNLCLQTVYFAIGVLVAFSGSIIPASASPKRRSSLQKIRDVLHSTLAFPVGMFVVATFWALYAVDRELVYPKSLDAFIPPWINHAMFVVLTFWGIYSYDRDLIYPESRAKHIPAIINHLTHTTVLPLLLVEKYLMYHHHPRRHNGIFILSGFALIYLLWILWIAYAADLWVYPVLRVMQNHERAIFIMFLLMFFISIYLLGEALTTFLWRKEKAVLAASTQKRK